MMNQNCLSDLVGNKTVVKPEIILAHEPDRKILSGPQCPECRMVMVRLGGCFSCPACGYGSCG
jgi:hypothetical protein